MSLLNAVGGSFFKWRGDVQFFWRTVLLEDMHIDMRLGFRGWMVTLREAVPPVLSRDRGDFDYLSGVVIFISDRMIFRRNLPPDMTHRNR